MFTEPRSFSFCTTVRINYPAPWKYTPNVSNWFPTDPNSPWKCSDGDAPTLVYYRQVYRDTVKTLFCMLSRRIITYMNTIILYMSTIGSTKGERLQLQRQGRFKKTYKGHNKVDWKIENTFLAYERLIHGSDNSMEKLFFKHLVRVFQLLYFLSD